MPSTVHTNAAPQLFLLGDSIIDNEWYVEGAASVTDCLQAEWPAAVTRIAYDGDTLAGVLAQYESAVQAGFRPDSDVLVLSVMGNDLRTMLEVYESPVQTVAEGFIRAYQQIQPILAAYDATVAALRARGVRHLVLVSIYPIYDMSLYAGERMQFDVIDRTGSWVLMTPILGIVSRHIIDTAKKHGAQVADLFGGDFGSTDIVRSIEPGPSASPKVARIIAAAAARCANKD